MSILSVSLSTYSFKYWICIIMMWIFIYVCKSIEILIIPLGQKKYKFKIQNYEFKRNIYISTLFFMTADDSLPLLKNELFWESLKNCGFFISVIGLSPTPLPSNRPLALLPSLSSIFTDIIFRKKKVLILKIF